jgi:hypothetical protein
VILGAETFAMLGDKTTVMSPEVLVESGIPCCRYCCCCFFLFPLPLPNIVLDTLVVDVNFNSVRCNRLVQNAGEFVVTFPGAYHSGFSHGEHSQELLSLKIVPFNLAKKSLCSYAMYLSHILHVNAYPAGACPKQ